MGPRHAGTAAIDLVVGCSVRVSNFRHLMISSSNLSVLLVFTPHVVDDLENGHRDEIARHATHGVVQLNVLRLAA
jgi:hypothetical protein